MFVFEGNKNFIKISKFTPIVLNQKCKFQTLTNDHLSRNQNVFEDTVYKIKDLA